MKAFVYVISGEHGRQKIGCSNHPKQRIRELQTGSPYPLKFEFVGEAVDDVGGQIEVEAHFMLAQHRAEGEWFVVPPDVAVTAVMAAAHRLGHRIRPVDPDALAPGGYAPGKPLWQHLILIPPALCALYFLVPLFLHWRSGQIPGIGFVGVTAIIITCARLAQTFLVGSVVTLGATWNRILGLAILATLAGIPQLASAEPALTGEQLSLVMWVGAASFAADKCPSFHFDMAASRSNIHGIGMTDAQVGGNDWSDAFVFARLRAAEGFERDPSGFCSRTWRAVGPEHEAVKFPMLTKD